MSRRPGPPLDEPKKMTVAEVRGFCQAVAANVEKVIVGKRAAIEQALVAVLSEGHVLIEDVPGTGKTMLARSLSISMGLDFRRLQCTPDLLPSDVTGVSVFNQKLSEFEFKPGPVFTNVLLADEINRATPRTQSALLEAMGELQVTIDGRTRALPRPYTILATQNPIEFQGTFPLPEAQLDRFLLRMTLGYPDSEDEARMLRSYQLAHPIDSLEQCVEGEQLPALQDTVRRVHVAEAVTRYILRLVEGTREHPALALGASPRATLALFRASQAAAALEGRDYVLPDDVQALFIPCLVHRLVVRPEHALSGLRPQDALAELLKSVEIPLVSSPDGEEG